MHSRIKALPPEVISLITAGEVVDSLAAVVRELAENSLDAGADRIVISLYPEQWRVRVADNGVGMSYEDLQQAALAHSTSKIGDRQDLDRVGSLGFRGEALHSLAQLATLEVSSRRADTADGWQALYDAQGQVVQIQPVAIAPGTVVTADQIFAQWQARREVLLPLNQQLKAVQATVHQLALSHPSVTWQLQQNDRDWFTVWAGKSARQTLPQILRDVQVNDLRELTQVVSEEGQESATLSVLLGLPDRCHRHRPDWIRVALNGRCVRFPELEQTILSSFRRTLPRDRFPVCFVHWQVPPDQVDWNRTPAKSEVYLHHLERRREQVAQAIEQALRLGSAAVAETLQHDRVNQLLKVAESEGGYSVSRQIQTAGAASDEREEIAAPPSPLRAVAQVHNTYILAEHPSGVWLVEQHIAHERVLYEQVCDRWQIVPLESPIVLNRLTLAQVEQLHRLGLDVDAFGEQTWIARSAPELLAQRQDCAEALIELSLGGDLQTAQVATACRSAIRNGTPLNLEEMQTLLNQWQQTRHPRTCPHGRPICLTLEESALSRFFRRHWVIGKSHGI